MQDIAKDTEAYKAGYNGFSHDYMTGQQYANRYMWAMLPHAYNNWLDGWNDAACWKDSIDNLLKVEK